MDDHLRAVSIDEGAWRPRSEQVVSRAVDEDELEEVSRPQLYDTSAEQTGSTGDQRGGHVGACLSRSETRLTGTGHGIFRWGSWKCSARALSA